MEYSDRYHVKWTPAADDDLDGIFEYIAEQSCSVVIASKLTDKIIAAGNNLSYMPHRFPVVDVCGLAKYGYHKRVEGRYNIFFRIDKNIVTIDAVIHGARNWGALLKREEVYYEKEV